MTTATALTAWVVDDDESIRWVLEKALARENLATRSFANARDAIAALAPLAPRMLLRVPDGAAADDALVFAIRTRATEVRALAPATAIGLAGRASVLAASAAISEGCTVLMSITSLPAMLPARMPCGPS